MKAAVVAMPANTIVPLEDKFIWQTSDDDDDDGGGGGDDDDDDYDVDDDGDDDDDGSIDRLCGNTKTYQHMPKVQ